MDLIKDEVMAEDILTEIAAFLGSVRTQALGLDILAGTPVILTPNPKFAKEAVDA